MECKTCNRVIPKYSHFIMDADIPINAFQSPYIQFIYVKKCLTGRTVDLESLY